MAINWNIIEGKWKQLKADGRTQWGKLTDNDWEQMAGHRDKLAGMLQERYGWTQKETDQHIDEFFERHSHPSH